MTISLRLEELDYELIKTFARYKKMTMSDYIRAVVMNDIEREYHELLDRQVPKHP